MTREVNSPGSSYHGRFKVFATDWRGWDKLCQSKPVAMRRCYIELADRPFPPGQLLRHHRLKGRLQDFWEYELTGGDRIRYKHGSDGRPVIVTYAGGHPTDTTH